VRIEEVFKGMIEWTHPVSMGTKYCQKWITSHKNCVGCESEVGCHKLHDIMIVVGLGEIVSLVGAKFK
jgi:hypothetical protein